MRFALIGFLVVIVCAVALGKPTKASTSCPGECSLEFDPICGTPKSGKGADLSFGNACVLTRYNCEHKEGEYSMKQKGECPGATAIRLQ